MPLDWAVSAPSSSLSSSPAGDTPTVAIALAKVPAAVPETDEAWSGPLLLNPGGPGGSGVDFAIALGREVQAVVGRTHSVIGFDPRGVNNTTPQTTCFPSETARVIWWLRAGGRVVGYSPHHLDLAVELARARSLGSVCEAVVSGSPGAAAAYVGTPNVARDMLAIVDAAWASAGRPGVRGLRFWGFSYGTALGQTFAAMFPDRVERLVLDGVVDLDDYYAGGWRTNLQDADRVIAAFYAYCAAAASACPLAAPTPALVARRLHRLLARLRREPVAVFGPSAPDWVADADVRTVIFWALYSPILRFPIAAEALAALEKGDGSKVAAIVHIPYECPCALDGAAGVAGDAGCLDGSEKPNTGIEADSAILCQDGGSGADGGRSNATLAEMAAYVDELKDQSEMVAGNWARIQMACTGWTVKARGLAPRYRQHPQRPPTETKNPILFVSTRLDPVTPLRNAEKARTEFAGAGLLVQESEGHCSVSAPSACSAARIGRYFADGVVDGFTAVCGADATPWSAEASAMLRGEGRGEGEEEKHGPAAVAMALVRKWRPVVPGGIR